MTIPAFLDSTLAAADATPLALPQVRNWPASFHVFDEDSVWAINAALASGRPLLLRGEPGGGKSQLARAAAVALRCPFLSRVVNARLEPEDLLYRFDAVARLAKAQILPRTDDAQGMLASTNFLLPEILWWAIAPGSARGQFERAAIHCGEAVVRYDEECGAPLDGSRGAVVLIDEIDKADAEVPNSLLETLSLGGFQLPFGGGWVRGDEAPPPLIVLTTNEDRELPPAFLRRCLVHHMDLDPDPTELRRQVIRRVRAHRDLDPVSDNALDGAITQLLADREVAFQRDLRPPGQAELLDLLRAVAGIAATADDQVRVLERIQRFALRKHREA